VTTQTLFASRPYAGEADLQAVCELLNACDAVDHLDDNYSVDSLRTELTDPRLDPARDIRVWTDAAGRMIAYGQLWSTPNVEDVQDASLYMRVHPDVREADLEPEIVAWGTERAREVGRERNKPVQLRSGTKDFDAARRATLERLGFAPIRYSYKMARPLDQPIPEPQFPAGYTLRHVADEAGIAEWVATFNESFIDHWSFHPTTVEERTHWMTDSHYLAERDLVAVAPDGQFGAFCLCWIDPEENERNNRNEGWIDVLGTRRGHRKIGLGRAMLLAGMHHLKAEGIAVAVLGVDAENPTGALRLYESVGFTKASTWVTYAKDL
jgi:mycothiol synthase